MKTSSFAVVALLFTTQALADAQEMPNLIETTAEPSESVEKFLSEDIVAEGQVVSSEHTMLQKSKGDKDGYGKKDYDSDDDGYMYCSDNDNDSDDGKGGKMSGKKEKYCRKEDPDTMDWVNVGIGGAFIAGIATWAAISQC